MKTSENAPSPNVMYAELVTKNWVTRLKKLKLPEENSKIWLRELDFAMDQMEVMVSMAFEGYQLKDIKIRTPRNCWNHLLYDISKWGWLPQSWRNFLKRKISFFEKSYRLQQLFPEYIADEKYGRSVNVITARTSDNPSWESIEPPYVDEELEDGFLCRVSSEEEILASRTIP